MGTLRRRAGKVPRHRAAAGARWLGALARHRRRATLAAVGAVALAAGLMLLPGHSASPAASGCGLVACASRLLNPAAAAESGARLPAGTQAPARPRTAPAQPAARATPSPSPSQLTPHHGQAKGLTHRRHSR